MHHQRPQLMCDDHDQEKPETGPDLLISQTVNTAIWVLKIYMVTDVTRTMVKLQRHVIVMILNGTQSLGIEFTSSRCQSWQFQVW